VKENKTSGRKKGSGQCVTRGNRGVMKGEKKKKETEGKQQRTTKEGKTAGARKKFNRALGHVKGIMTETSQGRKGDAGDKGT